MDSNETMDDQDFGPVLMREREARDINRNALAKEMTKFGAGKGAAANLARMEKGKEKTSATRITQIADALSNIAGDSPLEKDRLLKKLMSAAGVGGVTDISRIEYLRRKCEKRLSTSPDLKRHEIQTILDHVSIPTLKRIAEGDEHEWDLAGLLSDISLELSGKAGAKTETEYFARGTEYKFDADHTFVGGGDAVILGGALSGNQQQALTYMAMSLMYMLGR